MRGVCETGVQAGTGVQPEVSDTVRFWADALVPLGTGPLYIAHDTPVIIETTAINVKFIVLWCQFILTSAAPRMERLNHLSHTAGQTQRDHKPYLFCMYDPVEPALKSVFACRKQRILRSPLGQAQL